MTNGGAGLARERARTHVRLHHVRCTTYVCAYVSATEPARAPDRRASGKRRRALAGWRVNRKTARKKTSRTRQRGRRGRPLAAPCLCPRPPTSPPARRAGCRLSHPDPAPLPTCHRHANAMLWGSVGFYRRHAIRLARFGRATPSWACAIGSRCATRAGCPAKRTTSTIVPLSDSSDRGGEEKKKSRRSEQPVVDGGPISPPSVPSHITSPAPEACGSMKRTISNPLAAVCNETHAPGWKKNLGCVGSAGVGNRAARTPPARRARVYALSFSQTTCPSRLTIRSAAPRRPVASQPASQTPARC